ncbi:MAG: hypothetical protein P8L68_03160 [Paracoccaceae bacterium]|nr:hypothetical protein [Paracoccaceae bacterium]
MNWGTAMTDDSEKMMDLETFFEAGRKDAPEFSAALMSRIIDDIDSVADQREAPEPVAKGKGLLGRILDGIGGWPAVSGMATAGIVGIVVGISPPEAISEFTSAYVNGTTDLYLVDPYDSFGFESFEG